MQMQDSKRTSGHNELQQHEVMVGDEPLRGWLIGSACRLMAYLYISFIQNKKVSTEEVLGTYAWYFLVVAEMRKKSYLFCQTEKVRKKCFRSTGPDPDYRESIQRFKEFYFNLNKDFGISITPVVHDVCFHLQPFMEKYPEEDFFIVMDADTIAFDLDVNFPQEYLKHDLVFYERWWNGEVMITMG